MRPIPRNGHVAAGSIQHLPGRADFVLKEEGRTLPVSYVGSDPLPDTFISSQAVLAAFDTVFLTVTWLFGEYLLEE